MQLKSLSKHIRRLPQWALFLLSLLFSLLLGYLDHVAGEYSLVVFYLAPISLAAWFLRRRCSLTIAAICALESFLSNIGTEAGSFDLGSFKTWNSFTQMFILFLAGYLLFRLKHELDLHKELAFTDALTGLLNRRSFFELSGYELDCTRRYGRCLTLIYIDLDDFKAINDRFGHDAGDHVLATVARTLREQVRASDLVARVGGDEFVVLLPETGKDVARMLNELHQAVNEALQHSTDTATSSMGAVTFETPPASIDEMMKLADQLMYSAKDYGKNYFRHMVISSNEAPAQG